MLAYVQWAQNPQRSKHGPLKFRYFGNSEVIDVSTIDRVVGFFQMANNDLFIIDRENEIRFW